MYLKTNMKKYIIFLSIFCFGIESIASESNDLLLSDSLFLKGIEAWEIQANDSISEVYFSEMETLTEKEPAHKLRFYLLFYRFIIQMELYQIEKGTEISSQFKAQLPAVIPAELQALLNGIDGILAYKKGDFEIAKKYLRQALKKTNRDAQIGTKIYFYCSNYLGAAFYESGKIKESIEHLNQLLAELEPLQLTIQKRYTLNNLGNAYFWKGDYQKALLFYEDALFKGSSRIDEDHLSKAVILFNRGLIHEIYGSFGQAKKDYLAALEIRLKKQKPNSPSVSDVYNALGNISIDLNNLSKAKMYYQKAFEGYEQLGLENHKIALLILNNQANLLAKMGAFEQAEFVYRQCLDKNEEENHSFHSLVCTNLGEMLLKNGNAEGLVYLDRAIAITKSKQGNSFDLGDLKLIKAEYFLSQRSFDEGEKLAVEAQEILRASLPKSHPLVLKSEFILGEFKRQNHQIFLALDHFNKCIENAFSDYAEEEKAFSSLQMQSQEIILAALTAKSNVLFKQSYESKGDLTFLKPIEKGLILLSRMSKFYAYDLENFNFSKQAKEYYGNALDLFYKAYEISGEVSFLERSFEINEAAKRLSLLEQLKSSRRKLLEIEDEEDQESCFIKDLYFLQQELKIAQENGIPNPVKYKEDKEALFNTFLDFEQFFDQHLKEKPQFYQPIKEDSIRRFSSIQSTLPENAILLEYFKHQGNLFVHKITTEEIAFFKITLPANFDQTCKDWLTCLANPNCQEYSQFAKELRSLLLPPLQVDNEKKRLVLVLDEELQKIPFEVLMDEQNQFVIQQYAINYVYSFDRYLASKKENISTYHDRFFAIAPFAKSHNSEALIWTKEELFAIANLLGEKPSLEEIGKKELLEKIHSTRIIHFASHGVLDPDEDQFSYLEIQAGNPKPNSSRLYNYELLGLEIMAELVVLNTCNSGQGNIEIGEGLRSISRGFSFAGCKNVIHGLWSLDDRSTSQIMIQFYRFLKESLPKDFALQKAKLAFLKKANQIQQHPYFWAGTTLYGNEKPMLNLGHNQPLFSWRLLGMFPMLILVFFFFKRRNGKLTNLGRPS